MVETGLTDCPMAGKYQVDTFIMLSLLQLCTLLTN